jgi:hypothetical protein
MTEATETLTALPPAAVDPSPAAAAPLPRPERRFWRRGLSDPAGKRRRNAPGVVLALSMLTVELVVAAESFRGLVGFAHLIGIHGTAAYGVPVTLDGVGLIAALLALRAELAGESSGLYRLTLLAFTAASTAANAWHGAHAGGNGTEAALYLGGMSLAVAWLFNLTLRQIRATARRTAGLVSERLPHFSAIAWLRYPRRTWTALSLAVRDGHQTSRAAMDAASKLLDERREARELAALPVLEMDAEQLAKLSARDRLAIAFGQLGKTDIPAALAVLAAAGAPVDQSHAYQVRRTMFAGSES